MPPEWVIIPPVRIAPPVIRVGWRDIVVITSFCPEIDIDNPEKRIEIFGPLKGSGSHADKFTGKCNLSFTPENHGVQKTALFGKERKEAAIG